MKTIMVGDRQILLSEVVRLSIQTLNCMGLHEFLKVFGEESGRHLWSKYAVHYKRDAGEFVCYLDQSNLERLVRNALSETPQLDIPGGGK